MLRLDPGDDGRVVARLYGGNDDIIGALRVGRVELSGGRLCLHPDAARIKPDRISSMRHDGHVRDTRFRKHSIGAEKIGNLGALVQRKNCDGWPLALGRLQGLDRLLVLGG